MITSERLGSSFPLALRPCDDNQKARLEIAPAVEYNYSAYADATRRQFIAHYSVGVEHSSYIEETVLGVEEETLPVRCE